MKAPTRSPAELLGPGRALTFANVAEGAEGLVISDLARAVAARPKLVLADEPTANLDGENAETLMHLMRDLRDRHGMTFIFSTHDPRVVAHAVRVVTLVDGCVARDEIKPGEAPHEILPEVGTPFPARKA